VSKLLENWTPRREVATKTPIHGELAGAGQTKVITAQARANLVRNAFFRAILPGFDSELRGGGRGESGRELGKNQRAHVDQPARDVAPPAKVAPKGQPDRVPD
jgi:hypothetical protein